MYVLVPYTQRLKLAVCFCNFIFQFEVHSQESHLDLLSSLLTALPETGIDSIMIIGTFISRSTAYVIRLQLSHINDTFKPASSLLYIGDRFPT